MRAVDIIRAKRDGRALSAEQIRWFVENAVRGEVEPYQVTAFLMAVFFRGLSPAETSALTLAMRDSGRVVRFDLPTIPVDKHSTGGVGDKVSISLAPLVAACGATVPMIAGRGLGHTGGTLDKLEAIPGFSTTQTLERFQEITKGIGCCMIGQTEEICPADKRFYAWRDVTATVESLPLIVSSILSKKSAEGIGALVMDVKCGSGAFMKTEEDATALAEALCATGRELGLRVHALVTDMNEVLGRTVGNALETEEAIDFLKGQSEPDYAEITYALSAHMMMLSGVCKSLDEAEAKLKESVRNGTALEKMRRMIAEQGGDPHVVDDASLMGRAKTVVPYKAQASGYLAGMDSMKIGLAAMALGAGRERASDKINPAVGFVFEKKTGDAVRPGDILLNIHADEDKRLENAVKILDESFAFSSEKPKRGPIVRKVITSD